ncbi:ATP-binding response regulator [Pseudothauera rhizosphaerae]|uniref:Response regulator n=1 Tax=Pseudothauera rhizosphaerae TaxID=2565932 RepID=A0A4S4AN43_9RHOO|nr:response regulator [Pseudothauera rhizosphaerae]THF61005.1 response regulator [Pseudothauera rhizosphaerae]
MNESTATAAGQAEILIVDDTIGSLNLLGDLLSGAGYTVRAAQDGRMALRSARARPPELILLDVRMPGMDGYELCRLLKRDAQTRDVPVIFLSALHETGDMVKGFSLGAVDYVAKPFQPDEVLARVRTHIELYRLQTRLEERVDERTEQLRRSECALRVSQERLRELTRFLQDVREDERTSIARELHDELGQALTALRIDLGWLRKKCGDAGGPCKERIDAAHGLVERTIESLRRISEGLRPGMLDVLGLCAALEHLVLQFEKRWSIACTFRADRDEYDLDASQSIAVFRLVQEALTNVSRHAQATHVEIRMKESDGQLHLAIQDDGVGFEHQAPRRGFGLLGMSERVSMLGGEMSVDGSHGTRIAVVLPLTSGAER